MLAIKSATVRVGLEILNSFRQGFCCAFQKAGCDNQLGSTTKRDKCGVCGGDSSSCQTVSGTFNQVRYGRILVHTFGRKNSYSFIIKIALESCLPTVKSRRHCMQCSFDEESVSIDCLQQKSATWHKLKLEQQNAMKPFLTTAGTNF